MHEHEVDRPLSCQTEKYFLLGIRTISDSNSFGFLLERLLFQITYSSGVIMTEYPKTANLHNEEGNISLLPFFLETSSSGTAGGGRLAGPTGGVGAPEMGA